VRILVLCPHFEPDSAPTGVVMTELAARLVERGHELHIITALPWYTHHRVEPEWAGRPWRREATEWGSITRVHPFPTDKTNIAARAVGFAGFTALAALGAMTRRRRPDVVLTMSPPLTLGVAGWVAARLRRSVCVFNVQDVFPDVAVEVGAITGRRLIGALYRLESFVYRRADAVTVLSSDLAENVGAKIGDQDPAKVRVIPNFVDTERIAPTDRDTAYRHELGLGAHPVVMYAGNVGFSQPLDLMIETARRWAERDDGLRDVRFVINGGGSERDRFERSAAGLANVTFVDFQPPERLAEVLASGDIHLILLREGLARSSVPSKLYSILASGRPVFASVDPGTEVDRVLVENGCGRSVGPGDLDEFETGLAALVADEAGRQRMGRRGREFVEEWVSPSGVAAAYEALFVELAGGRSRGRRKVPSRR